MSSQMGHVWSGGLSTATTSTTSEHTCAICDASWKTTRLNPTTFSPPPVLATCFPVLRIADSHPVAHHWPHPQRETRDFSRVLHFLPRHFCENSTALPLELWLRGAPLPSGLQLI